MATELPTVTQVATAVHETPFREADMAVTVWPTQVAPPLAVVKISPCPLLATSKVSEVVPTTVQCTPGTPTIGVVVVVGGGVVVVGGAVVVVVGVPEPGGVVTAVPGAGGGAVEVVDGTGRAPLPVVDPLRHEIPLSEPMPGGVATVAQFVPPSVVRARAPATWSRATAS